MTKAKTMFGSVRSAKIERLYEEDLRLILGGCEEDGGGDLVAPGAGGGCCCCCCKCCCKCGSNTATGFEELWLA